MAHVLAAVRFLDFSFLSAYIYKMVRYFEDRKTYRETYNQLSKLTDKELSDIGLHRGLIHSVSIGEYSPDRSDNPNLRGWV
jgi:uncharacterized protein YjiS (DUF1127 family)